ncbi:MAG: hypothetical protein IIY73_07090 [Solobacterium sp.]|nr:hypothetical protein [Solobacterium sp.]
MEKELRYGYVDDLYETVMGRKKPAALDRLEEWFPGMIVTEETSDDKTRTAARYDDREDRIHAVRVNGKLYTGDNDRIAQITGRLIGTASSNKEKERRTAERIQKRLAAEIAEDSSTAAGLLDNVYAHLTEMNDEQIQQFNEAVYSYALGLAAAEEQPDTLFPMDEEIYSRIVYNAVYQLHTGTGGGLANAWLWLLCGGLLRSEAGRITRIYDSAWTPLFREEGITRSLADKVDYLLHPEDYEPYYWGDDTEKRFPGIAWYCDGCGAHLDEQKGFDDRLPEWKCTACGTVNTIDITHIYENEQDYRSGAGPVNAQQYYAAVDERRKE